MESRDQTYSRRLFLAFAAVVVAFIFATLYVNWRTLEIGTQTRNVSLNALPSIEHLTFANDDFRDIEVIGAEYADLPAEGRGAARDAIDAKWRDLDRELSTYASLPSFDNERALYDEVPASLRASDEALRHVLDEVDAGNLAAAQRDSSGVVRQRFDFASEKLQRLLHYNAGEAQESTTRIEALRDHTAAAALVLDGLAVIVAIGATAWVSRLFRQYARLERRHGELVEQRATELEGFGKRVAHDLLSPLSSLTYCLTSFKRAAESDPALADAMTRARTCVQRAQTMVDGIFDFARSGGRPNTGAATPVHEVVEHVAEELRSSDIRTRPEIEIEPFSQLFVACNRGVLTSVVSNLMRNAEKYMSDSPLRRITVRAREEGAIVRVEVEDTGPGVAPELRTAIFEPYVRADGATQPGLGLGLATVKRLCVAHGGEVGVRSTIGRGSSFWFTLPKAEATDEEMPASVTKVRHAV